MIADSLVPESLAALLTRITARSEKLPLLITIARKPPANIRANVFGRPVTVGFLLYQSDWVTLIPGDAGSVVRSVLAGNLSLSDAAQSLQHADHFQIILRFIDADTAKHILKEFSSLWRMAKIVLVEDSLTDKDRGYLRKGFPQSWLEYCSVETEKQLTAWYPETPAETEQAASPAVETLPMKTLVIMDNSLTGERGHNLSVAGNITQGALASGARVVWAANTRLPVSACLTGVVLEHSFARANYDAQQSSGPPADLSEEILHGWKILIEKHDDPYTHYLTHSATGHHFRAAQRLLANEDFRGIVHLCTFYETEKMPARLLEREIDRDVYTLTRNALFNQRLFLWAETASLAHLYSNRFGAAVRHLPLPAPAWADRKTDAAHRDRLTVIFLGAARREKGFLDLPSIVSAILNDSDLQTRFQFVIQATVPIGGMKPEIAEAVSALQNLPNVRIIREALDDGRYRDILMSSDVVLLPYRPQNYAARGSGILIEALACGKICLVSDGTALALHDKNAPVIACRTISDWVAALRAISSGLPEARRRAEDYAASFRVKQSSGAYIQRLISPHKY